MTFIYNASNTTIEGLKAIERISPIIPYVIVIIISMLVFGIALKYITTINKDHKGE